MALFYKKVQRGNPSKPEAPKLWYPLLKSIGLVRDRQVAKLLAEETTLNPKEAEMALYQLLKVVMRLLLDGHTVQLGELGTFCVVIEGEGSVKEEEVNATKIKKTKIRFIASEETRNELKHASFKDAATMQ
ncbi:MAG: HU family DNA-binding protein [Tannerella sp.]|jgi:predicted histone-like DNA-binding protein|nr:HU family DNA-binding protein [Tannerella sp.]